MYLLIGARQDARELFSFTYLKMMVKGAGVSVDLKILCKDLCCFFSSPEHEVLMVSYCDQSLSVVSALSTFCFKRLLLQNG